MTACLYVVVGCCFIVDRETEGVSCCDTTDSTRDIGERTDTGNNVTRATQPSWPKTHEKADMAVVSATYPGEQRDLECMCM